MLILTFFLTFGFFFANFGRPVLNCIDADFCEIYKILTPLHRSKLKSSQIFVKLFHSFVEIHVKLVIFSAIFIEFCINFNENFSEFR